VRLPYFALSANNANAPVTVQCLDMSLGGLAWHWSFGDGATSTARSPTHVFTNFGAFPVVQTVSGTSGSATATRMVVTDITPPAGTVTINGGATLATNTVVILALAATDNSGLVSRMRLSNDGTTWSALEPYATNRAWTLSAGDGAKTVHVQFADAATNLSASATDTITLDTSPLPVASVVSTNVPESASQVTVRVTLSAATARVVTVDYATSNGTATAGADFTAASGRLTFPAGSTAQTFNVALQPDAQVEINETFAVHLFNATNALAGPAGTVTIVNDDQPSVSFASTNFNVGEGGTNGVVTVRLNGASGQPVTVAWLATNGTAAFGQDFSATNGVVTVPPGETNASFLIRVINDTLDEFSETVVLRLTAATNALLAAPTNAVLTILDDDAPRVSFSAPAYPVLESDGFVQVAVWLSKPVADPVEFDYLVLGGSASPSDYIAASGHRVFSPGTTGLVLIVNITDDALTEPDETVHLALSNFLRAEPGAHVEADAVIWDDDRGPRLVNPRRDAGGAFLATARGRAGQRFVLEMSPDLGGWFPLATLTNSTGTLEVSDPAAAGRSRRFYRTSLAVP
jgi:PKD repeat protein